MKKIKCPKCDFIQDLDLENNTCKNCGNVLFNANVAKRYKSSSSIRTTFIICAILFVLVIISFRIRIEILQMITLPLLILSVLVLGFLFTKK